MRCWVDYCSALGTAGQSCRVHTLTIGASPPNSIREPFNQDLTYSPKFGPPGLLEKLKVKMKKSAAHYGLYTRLLITSKAGLICPVM